MTSLTSRVGVTLGDDPRERVSLRLGHMRFVEVESAVDGQVEPVGHLLREKVQSVTSHCVIPTEGLVTNKNLCKVLNFGDKNHVTCNIII